MPAPRRPDRRVTQDDVAQAAGVTRSVVSYVLTGAGRSVAAETKERVLKAIDELGYRPNKAAQSLGAGAENPLAARQIGIVLNGAHVFLRPYYAEILAGIHQKAHEEDYHIRFIRFFGELKNPLLFNGLIHGEEVCGLILIALDQSVHTDADRALIDQLKARVPNTVCVEWQHPGLPSITFDRQGAASTAAAHLLGLGHRHIAYIGESDQRTAGFRQALEAIGAAPLLEPGGDSRAGYAAAGRLLPANPQLTALVAGSDEVAFGILTWCAEHGRRVPEDLALVSIDNLETAEFTVPPLTSVQVEKAAMGRLAVQKILQNQRAAEPDLSLTLLPTTLIVRRSSGSSRS